MKITEAIKALYEGKRVALPEWGGYWFVEDGVIKLKTKEGEIRNTPWFDNYSGREDWLVVGVQTKNEELVKTGVMMASTDYKERFLAEYIQQKNRYHNLFAMVANWEVGTLQFTPTCPIETYKLQLRAMKDYLDILVIRAKMEGVELC